MLFNGRFTRIDIDALLRQLQQQKAALQCNQKEVIQWLAKKFLLKIKEEKVSTIWSAYNELQVLKTDLLHLGADLKSESFPIVMDEAEEKEKVEGVVPEVGKKRKLDVSSPRRLCISLTHFKGYGRYTPPWCIVWRRRSKESS